jgi:hypothetical protein
VWGWAAPAIYIWLFCILGSIVTAKGIASTPQPDQQMWVALVTWSPALPALCAALAALIVRLCREGWRPAALSAAHVFLWTGLALVFLWVPKAP